MLLANELDRINACLAATMPKIAARINQAVIKKFTSGPVADFEGRLASSLVDRNFRFKKCDMLRSAVLLRALEKNFPGWDFFSEHEMERDFSLLRSEVMKLSSNLFLGPCFYVCLPRLTVADYGSALNDFVEPLYRSYTSRFLRRSPLTFFELIKLEGAVQVLDDRHWRLVKRLENGPTGVLFFPDALRGVSPIEARELVKDYPQNFSATGLIDGLMAVASYPEELVGGTRCPGLQMAGVTIDRHVPLLKGMSEFMLLGPSVGGKSADTSCGLTFAL